MKLVKFISILLLWPLITFAQFSKTHYIPPLTAQNIAEDQYIYISTPTTTNVNFRIIEIGGAVINGTVRNNNPYIHTIGTGTNTRLFTPKTVIGKIQNKGFIIEADDLVLELLLNAVVHFQIILMPMLEELFLKATVL